MTAVQDLFAQVEVWLQEGRRFVLATVVGVEKSAPRPPGATMAVNDRGEVLGSVSGGCVEGALYEEARAMLEGGAPKLLTYGIEDDDAFAVGLTCGGTIHVFVEPSDELQPHFASLADAVRSEEPVALVTVVQGAPLGRKLVVTGSQALGSTGVPELDAVLVDEARAMLRQGRTGLRRFGPKGERRREEVAAFVQSFAPPPRMHVFGAIDFAQAMVRIGKFLGYRVTLCDARAVFATRERFPEADEIVVAWPHEYLAEAEVGPRDAICVLTHDPKFDVPVLKVALGTPAGYIGALGSRATHEKRRQALREAGVPEEDIRRISAPAGLDIGGRTPEETALSIAAELVARHNGRPGGRLRDRSGPIHATAPAMD
jgi:xanthine dehydrogenase accessory factor